MKYQKENRGHIDLNFTIQNFNDITIGGNTEASDKVLSIEI